MGERLLSPSVTKYTFGMVRSHKIALYNSAIVCDQAELCPANLLQHRVELLACTDDTDSP
jgi:hypothetical protein